MFKIFKRIFDIISASLLFLLISPFFVVLMLFVRILIGSPIFFTQARTGLNGQIFYIFKFRTMTNDVDLNGDLLPDEMRQTPFGTFLRSSSLDELPELLSIIKGDMSVIGPRPLPPIYDDYYTNYEKNRFKVRGGLIPPDSIYHNPTITWDEQLKCEAEYANDLCLKKDIEIFLSVINILSNRNNSDYGMYVRKPLNIERMNRQNEN